MQILHDEGHPDVIIMHDNNGVPLLLSSEECSLLGVAPVKVLTYGCLQEKCKYFIRDRVGFCKYPDPCALGRYVEI